LGSRKSRNGSDLPPFGEHVWVECEDFWLLAYVDERRVWRGVADDREAQVKVRADAEVPRWLPRRRWRAGSVWIDAEKLKY
jgi:hypothetical protein